jgi:hypothetical protein
LQVLITAKKRAIECVQTACLIPIKTDVTIDKKVTHPELFQSIGVLLSQLVASFFVTDSNYAIGEAIVFSIGIQAALKVALIFTSLSVRAFGRSAQ